MASYKLSRTCVPPAGTSLWVTNRSLCSVKYINWFISCFCDSHSLCSETHDIVAMVIEGSEKGESVAMLLSPSWSPPIASNCSHHSNGSLFTMFLTAPLQAFCLLLGLSGTDIDLDIYNKAEVLLSQSLNKWGLALATSDTLNPVWGQILGDPFIRRLLLRFIFCEAVLSLYAPVYNKNEFLPTCVPSLPMPILPPSDSFQSVILQLGSIFGATKCFIFSEDALPENILTNVNEL